MTKEKLIEQLQAEFAKEFVGIDFNFSQYIQDNVEEGLSGVKGANSVKIIGPDLDDLGTTCADRPCAKWPRCRGLPTSGAFWVLGQPNLNITIDRAKAARYGLSVNDVNSVVQAALGGTIATTVLEADRQFGVVGAACARIPQQLDEVRNLKIGVQNASSGNAYIPLSELATITLDTGASYIFRERNQRFVPIKFSVRGRDLAGAVAEAQQRINQNREAADRLSDRLGRRVRMAAAGEETAGHHCAGHLRPHHGAALWIVQFVARQPAGSARVPVCGLRRSHRRSTFPDWISAFRRRSDSSRCSASRS